MCGCWVHAKRKFSELAKADGGRSKGTLADRAVKMISKIFHENGKLDGLAGGGGKAGRKAEENQAHGG